jgi:transglutaminase-like putative cysteine protease
MRYQIHHQTTYLYNQPVVLSPHLLRLRPKSDGGQTLREFKLTINPEPLTISTIIDLDGNSSLQIWFNQSTEELLIDVVSEIETHTANPFQYLLEPWATCLPFDYPISLKSQLQPYGQFYGLANDPNVGELAQEIMQETEGNVLSFLFNLNDKIYKNCEYIIRPIGEPYLPGKTWKNKQGSCRDFVVLFMDVCRCMGLATRFVSGYQEGDLEQEKRDLHAWVEVYLPGGGWKGYDPTHGLAVSDRHISLVSSPIPRYCAPVQGTARPVNLGHQVLESQMLSEIAIDLLS